ncbi:MAG: glycosyl hydrolase [Pseudomonadota bacterium]
MSAIAEVSRRALFRGGLSPRENTNRWTAVDGLAAGSGDVFWGGWADEQGAFIGGDEGAIFHFAGATWERMPVPTTLPVHALWGTSRESLWAVGWMGLILRFDGQDWHHVQGGATTDEGRYASVPENAPLFGIDGTADGTAFAVGDHGTILHFNGTAWIAETSGTRLHLRTVRCLSDGRVLAAGADGTLLMRAVEGGWHTLPCPLATTFVAALELDGGDILLAGGRYLVKDNGFRGDLVLLDQEGAHPVFTDVRLRRFRDLAETPAGVLCVGDSGQMHLLRNQRLDRLDTGTTHDLHGLVRLPHGGALAVGDFGTVLQGGSAALTAFAPAVHAGEAPSAWSTMASGTDRQLWGLWTDPQSGIAHACGEEGTVLVLDRGKWEALPPPGDLGLHALARATDGRLLAAGQLGEIHRFDGTRWEKDFDLLMDITILSLWSDGQGSLLAAGDEGLVLRGGDRPWTRMPSGTRSALYGLWGPDADHLLAVGDFGLVLRWNGTRWDEFNAGTEHFLFDVWGRALDDIFVVGLSGTIGHFNGSRWRITAARARKDLLSVAGTATHVLAVGAGGAAMRHDGQRWEHDPTGTDVGLRSLTILPDGTALAAGDGGTILMRETFAETDSAQS